MQRERKQRQISVQGFPGSRSAEKVLTKFSDGAAEDDMPLVWTVANIIPAKALPATHCWPLLGLITPPKLARVKHILEPRLFRMAFLMSVFQKLLIFTGTRSLPMP